jgi:hypothetical protein
VVEDFDVSAVVCVVAAGVLVVAACVVEDFFELLFSVEVSPLTERVSLSDISSFSLVSDAISWSASIVFSLVSDSEFASVSLASVIVAVSLDVVLVLLSLQPVRAIEKSAIMVIMVIVFFIIILLLLYNCGYQAR